MTRNNLPFVFAIAVCAALFTGACSRRDTHNAPPPLTIKKAALSPGDTLGQCIADLGLPAAAQQEIITSLGTLFNLRTCRSGDQFEVAVDSAARWHSFDYFPPGLEYYTLRRSTAGTVAAERRTKQGTRVERQYTGVIETSLWEAGSGGQHGPAGIDAVGQSQQPTCDGKSVNHPDCPLVVRRSCGAIRLLLAERLVGYPPRKPPEKNDRCRRITQPSPLRCSNAFYGSESAAESPAASR